MRRLKKYLTLSAFMFSFGAFGQPFTSGNIVVCRIGDGTSNINTDLTFPVFLDEYTTSGSLVRSIAMPVTTTGSNRMITMWGGSRNIMGMMNLSADKQYLTIAGYDAPPGTDANTIINGSPLPARVIGLIRYDGGVNTTTAVTNWSDNGALNSVVTTNGIDFWCAGQGAINGGIRYTTMGSTTTTQIAGTPTALRTISIQNGQLYTTVGDVFAVGVGTPTTSGQTTAALTLGSGSKDQFYLADLNPAVAGPDVLYVADQTNGLRKFSLVGGVWTLNGTIGAGSDSYRGLTGIVNGSSVTIFATRRGGNNATLGGGDLVRVDDNAGYNAALTASPTVLASVPTDMASFRGVAVAPVKAPACSAPASLVAFNITPASSQFQWNAIPGSAGYEYALTNSPTPPNAGTPTTATSYTATGLSQGQTYYFHVRTDCLNFNTSAWSTISFVPTCSAPPSVAIKSAGNSAELKWNTIFGATGYEYAISNSATPPSSGISTADTAIVVNDLSSVTQYYIHVRSQCGAGQYSQWTTNPFKTSCLSPVVSAVSNGDATQFRWNKVNGAVSYEYAVTTYRTPPLGGTFLQDTAVQFSKFNPGTAYYFHLRTKCGESAGESSWTTVSFQTTGLDAYPNPVMNTLTIKLYGVTANTGDVLLIDAMGRIVKKVVMTNNSIEVDVRDLSGGIYIVKYSDGINKYMVKVLKK